MLLTGDNFSFGELCVKIYASFSLWI